MTREQVWEPVACPSEGFNAPIGDVCLDLWTGSRPCLRTLGGEVLRKKAFMEELGMDDEPLRLLVVVQRRPGGGWAQLGSVAEQSKLLRQRQRQGPAAGIPAPPAPAPPLPAGQPPAPAGPAPPAPIKPPALHAVLPLTPAGAAPPAPIKPPAPAQLPLPAALLPQPRGSSTRRRSLLACPACKSVRRGLGAAEAAEALTCPVCMCEVEPPEHTHLDCGHPFCNPCLANYLHTAYQGGVHPKCQKPDCQELLSEEDLQQGVLVLCDCGEVRRQRAAARLPPLDDPSAAYQRFTALATAAVAREGGELIECRLCHFMILAEADSPADAPCPCCHKGQPLAEAREAARRPRGIQQLEGGERVLFCPECGFGPQQKAKYCNKVTCGGCRALLCWCCGNAIGEQRAYDHFADGKCPLYGLPGERPEMTAAEMEAAQERAVQREAYYQRAWDAIIHPAHDAVRHMWRATPPDLQADDALRRQVRAVMHSRLERAFNEVTEAAAAREEQLPYLELLRQLLPRAQALLDAAWPGWAPWEGVVGAVLRAVQRALCNHALGELEHRLQLLGREQAQQPQQAQQAQPVPVQAQQAQQPQQAQQAQQAQPVPAAQPVQIVQPQQARQAQPMPVAQAQQPHQPQQAPVNQGLPLPIERAQQPQQVEQVPFDVQQAQHVEQVPFEAQQVQQAQQVLTEQAQQPAVDGAQQGPVQHAAV